MYINNNIVYSTKNLELEVCCHSICLPLFHCEMIVHLQLRLSTHSHPVIN